MGISVLKKIASYEWDMLLATNSQQTHLECKNDKYTFFLMRESQWAVYPLDIQAAYLRDIHQAVREHRNIVFEKYAYMMEETTPCEYDKIKSVLPPISQEKRNLVDRILTYHKKWYEEAKQEFPLATSFGRTSTCDSYQQTSVFTYLKGELFTYSMDTLQALLSYVERVQKDNGNLVVETYKQYMELK